MDDRRLRLHRLHRVEDGRPTNLPATAWPVSTAWTPGSCNAPAVSMRTMRAWGNGLRSTFPYSIPGNRRSPA